MTDTHWLLVAFYRTMLGVFGIAIVTGIFFVIAYVLFHFTGALVTIGGVFLAWVFGCALERIFLNRNL